ncbi:MAG: hypothetical protein JWM46_728 [Candidatus Kaiserbacteria bacterium]|nr:hypothetical protein [Candidatus Kaiserbacteria bacterium]
MKRGHFDKPLMLLIALLVVGGCLIFASAAFGLLARGSTDMSSVVFNHLVLGVGLGLVAMVGFAFFDYRLLRPYAIHIFVLALIGTAAVFVPHLGFSHGGGRRWISIAHISLQPSEGLKLAAILMAAAYFSSMRKQVESFKYGFGGFAAILAAPVLILIAQPDLGTLGVICFSVAAIFFAAGASWKQILASILIGIIALTILAAWRPYVRDRITTFFDPSKGQQSQAYQIKQSLIAVGSGGFTGRGLGQGIQKFTYLPEPMGDSIFAVAGEEMGFIGTVSIVLLFLAFALRGYSIGTRSPDMFGSLLAIGISTYLVVEAFINIAAMLGVAPLTGIPLTFMSQGGSAMLASLAAAGVLLNISRQRRAHSQG